MAYMKKSELGNHQGLVAQWIARLTSDQEVVGSSPIWVAFLLPTHSNSQPYNHAHFSLQDSHSIRFDSKQTHT